MTDFMPREWVERPGREMIRRKYVLPLYDCIEELEARLKIHDEIIAEKLEQIYRQSKRIEELEAALKATVDAHKTGRFEPAQIAYENAMRVLNND